MSDGESEALAEKAFDKNRGPSWDQMAGEGPAEAKPNPARFGRLTFRPMPGKIVVKVIGDREKIGSGLLWAAPSRENPRTTGRVVAIYEPFLINEDTESKPYVAVGDVVVFGQFSGTKIELEGTTVLILKEADILTMVDVDGDPEKELAQVEAER